MAGIAVGFGIMILLVGIGLAAPLARMPSVQAAARWIGIAWLLYLAWQIASAAPPGEGPPRPLMGFRGAALFQWVNPKAWLLALGVATTWVSADAPPAPQVALMAFLFFLVGMPCNLVWAAIGTRAAGLLTSPGRLRTFNVTMAALLVASIVPLVLE
jgi:threonine/homoserine/homoserine lactone efflux protein